MEAIVKLVPKHNLYIVDDNHYATGIKHSVEKQFGKEVNVNIFNTIESSIDAIKKSKDFPHVILIDYSKNKRIIDEQNEYAVDVIQRISPDTQIVILSSENTKETALKVLGYGAHCFVLKDQFALEHINTTLEKCFHPAKV